VLGDSSHIWHSVTNFSFPPDARPVKRGFGALVTHPWVPTRPDVSNVWRRVLGVDRATVIEQVEVPVALRTRPSSQRPAPQHVDSRNVPARSRPPPEPDDFWNPLITPKWLQRAMNTDTVEETGHYSNHQEQRLQALRHLSSREFVRQVRDVAGTAP